MFLLVCAIEFKDTNAIKIYKNCFIVLVKN